MARNARIEHMSVIDDAKLEYASTADDYSGSALIITLFAEHIALYGIIDEVRPSPWSRSDWHGHLVSVDGTPADDFTKDDVLGVVRYVDDGDGWSGTTACIIKLVDGRYAGWEAFFDVTGDGFSCDAYGGDSDILFAASPYLLVSYLSERARDLLADQARWNINVINHPACK